VLGELLSTDRLVILCPERAKRKENTFDECYQSVIKRDLTVHYLIQITYMMYRIIYINGGGWPVPPTLALYPTGAQLHLITNVVNLRLQF